MKNAERLEEIKKEVEQDYQATKKLAHVLSDDEYDNMNFAISYKHIKWLIEQAERVSELENRFTQRVYIKGLKDENSRLREALEFYANEEGYKLWEDSIDLTEHIHDVDFDNGDKARQALQGEST